jgi:hypothetical protein
VTTEPLDLGSAIEEIARLRAERDTLRADLAEVHLWLSLGCMPAETYRPANEGIARVDAQLAQLRGRVAGEPPVLGWTCQIHRVRGVLWSRENGRGDAIEVSCSAINGVRGHIPMWRVTGRLGGPHGPPLSQSGPYPTARVAMRLASERLAAGGSNA